MSVSIADLQAMIGADLSGLEKGIKDAQKKLEALGQGVPAKGIDSFIDRARKGLASFGDAATKVGTGISVGLTLPLTLLAKKVFEIGAPYEKAMNIFQVATQATAAEMNKAAKVAEALGNDLNLPGVSAADAAQAMTELGKAGFTAGQAMDGARGVLELSTAANIKAGQAAEITANALNAFGLAASESGRVADLLAASANATSAEITDVAMALQQSSASAAALKIPIDDLVTAIGEMANAGIKGSDAGTSLKTFMAALTPTTKNAAAAMKQLGIDAFDSQGNFIGLREVIQQAQPALAKMSDEQQQFAIKAAFGSDAQRAANIILGQGVEKFDALKEAVNKSGAAQELAGAQSKGLSGAVEALSSTLETVGIAIYKSVGPGIESMVRGFGDLAGKLSSVNPEVIKAGAAFVTTFAVGGAAALAIGKFATLLSGLTKGSAIITLVIAGASALASAYASDFGDMRETVNRFFRDYSKGADGVEASNAKLKKESGEAAEFFRKLGVAIAADVDLILTGIKSIWIGVSSLGKGIVSLLSGDMSGAVVAVKSGFDEIGRVWGDFSKGWDHKAQEFKFGTQKRFGAAGKEMGDALGDQLMQSLGIQTVRVTTVTAEMGQKAARIAAENYRKGLGEYKNLYETALAEIIKAAQAPTVAAAKDVGEKAGKAIPFSMRIGLEEGKSATIEAYKKFAIDLGNTIRQNTTKQFFQSPFFIIHTFTDELANSIKAASAYSAVGKAAGDSIKSGFESTGFDKSLDKIYNSFVNFPAKLESQVAPKVKNAAKQMLKDMRAAFEDTLAAINDFVKSTDSKAQITAEIWAQLSVSVRKSLIDQTRAFKEWENTTQIVFAGMVAHPEKAKAALDSFAAKVKQSREVIVPEMTKMREEAVITFDAFRLGFKTLADFKPAIDDSVVVGFNAATAASVKLTESLRRDGAARKANFEREQEAIKRYSESLTDSIRDLERQIPSSINTVLDAFLNMSGKTGIALKELIQKVRGWAADIVGVIDTLPGKFGDAARGILRTVDQWVTFADKVLAVLNRINSSIPASVGDALEKVIGVIKGSQSKVEQALDQVFGPATQKVVGQSASKLGSFFGGKMLAGIAGALGGASMVAGVFGSGMGRVQGGIQGGLGGLMAGASIGMMFGGPVGAGIGAIIGGISGAVLGIFGGGKTVLQKAQEAAALQQAKDAIKISQQSVLKALEESKQSLLETTEKARQLLENLRFYDRVGKPAIKAFFKDLSLFMKLLAEEATKWSAFAKGDIKTAAEQLGAGVNLIAALFPVLSGIGTYFKLGMGQLDIFFADADAFFEKLGEFVLSIPKKVQKQIGKFGSRTEAGVSILGPILDFIKGATEIKDVPDSSFDIVENTLNRMVERLGRIGESFKKSFLKMVGFVGENLTPGVSLLSSVLQVVKDAVGAQAPSDADLDAIFSSLMSMSTRMIAFANELSTEGLQKASAIATAITPVAAALKTWAEASTAIRGYTKLGAETFTAIADDILQGNAMLTLMKGSVDVFESLTTYIADHIKTAGDKLKEALLGYAAGLNAAVSAINGALNLQGGLANGNFGSLSVGGGSVGTLSLGGAGTLGRPVSSGASSRNETYNFNFYGDVSAESGFQNRVVRAIVDAKRARRLD